MPALDIVGAGQGRRVRFAPTEFGALKKAEAMAGRMPGTAEIKVMADDETADLESATILGQFGEITDDFGGSPQGG